MDAFSSEIQARELGLDYQARDDWTQMVVENSESNVSVEDLDPSFQTDSPNLYNGFFFLRQLDSFTQTLPFTKTRCFSARQIFTRSKSEWKETRLWNPQSVVNITQWRTMMPLRKQT